MLTFASWAVKHICFVRFHFFRLSFHHDFLSKPLQLTANLYFRTLSLQRGDRLYANTAIYYVSGTIFSRRPTLGRVSFERCANFTFSIFVFIFSQKWVWRQLHTLGLLGPLREASEAVLHWKNNAFCMFSLRCLNKSFAFLSDSFPEIMQKALFLQYKINLIPGSSRPDAFLCQIV